MVKKNTKRPSITPDNPHGAHVRIVTRHLRDRLSLMKGIVPRRVWRKDCGVYHLVVKEGGKATIGATDLKHQMKLKLQVQRSLGTGTLLIQAQALDAILATYTADTIQFALDGTDPEVVEAEGPGCRLKLPAVDPKKDLKTEVIGSITGSGWLVRGDDLL